MGCYPLRLYASLRPPLPPINWLSTCFPMPIRRYSNQPSNKESNGRGMERAPTTAEEFQRVADEFERVAEAKAQQGFTSQTIEKAHDGTQEAVAGDSRVESVKEKYKEETEGTGDFRKTGDE